MAIDSVNEQVPQMALEGDCIRGSAMLTLIALPWRVAPEYVRAFLSPSTVANSTYPKPLGVLVNLSSTIRTFVTSQSANRSEMSPEVASKDRFPICAVYGGRVGRGSSSLAYPRSRSFQKSVSHDTRFTRGRPGSYRNWERRESCRTYGAQL